MQLRQYQQQAINDIRLALKADRRVLFRMPTGGGKSHIIAHIASVACNKNNKVMIGTHRHKILSQNMSKLENMNITIQVIDANNKRINWDADCYIVMIQTLNRRLRKSQSYRKLIQSISLFIWDEAHSANFDPCFEFIPKDAYVIGLTATPQRRGQMRQLGDFYSKIIDGPSVADLVQQGYICRSKPYTLPAPKLSDDMYSHATGDYNNLSLQKVFRSKVKYEGVINNFLKICPKAKTICFCTGSLHCAELTKEFNDAGISAKYLLSDGTVEGYEEYTDERDKLVQDFLDGKFQVLLNLAIFIEGFDDPSIECVIMDFSTVSHPKHIQVAGRGCRKQKGKNWYYLIDMGGNIDRHGLPEDDSPIPSLWHNSSVSGIAPTKLCPGCERLVPVQCSDCPWCKYHWTSEAEIYEAELEEYKSGERGTSFQQWVAEEYDRAVNKGYKNVINYVLVRACHANMENPKKAFEEAVSVLRTSKGSQVNPRYWWYFKKNILSKAKRTKRE